MYRLGFIYLIFNNPKHLKTLYQTIVCTWGLIFVTRSLKNRPIIGLTEQVTLYGNNKKKKTLVAKIDTGADKGSIDKSLVKELMLGPVIKNTSIRQAHGTTKRPVIAVKVKIDGKTLKRRFTVADRSHMKYRILIGNNILRRGFLIDPSRK